METASIPIPRTDCRRAPRALVCASAVVTTEDKPATEHMVYDLSTGGVRLCGLPRAQIGDEVTVRLRLPRGSAPARGHLLRVASMSGRPDFAIEFFDVSADTEDAIHDAVVEALSHPERRSVLLLQDAQQEWWRGRHWPGWGWLDPMLPICATAITLLEAVQCLEEHRLDVGIVDSVDHGTRDSELIGLYPEVSWRTIDDGGRLHRF